MHARVGRWRGGLHLIFFPTYMICYISRLTKNTGLQRIVPKYMFTDRKANAFVLLPTNNISLFITEFLLVNKLAAVY